MKVLVLALLLVIPVKATEITLDQKLIELWGQKEANIVIEKCNAYAKNPKHCKIVHTFVAKSESNLCKDASKFNCYWNSKYKFNSTTEAHTQFNKTYNKYYYKNLKPSDFYSSKSWVIPRTHYCMSENSSNSSNFCPNWAKTAWHIYNLLINLK